eukprot:8889033-Karenia_brevis.AAC.1
MDVDSWLEYCAGHATRKAFGLISNLRNPAHRRTVASTHQRCTDVLSPLTRTEMVPLWPPSTLRSTIRSRFLASTSDDVQSSYS